MKHTNTSIILVAGMVWGLTCCHAEPPKSDDFAALIKEAEAKIEAFAQEKSYKTGRDGQGRVVLSDASGTMVPVPEEFSPLTYVMEKRITAFAEKNGHVTEKNPQGRLIVKDKIGKVVPLPPGILPPLCPHGPPVAVIEDALNRYAKEKAYTSKRDEQGRLSLVDADGKIVPPPADLLPPPPNAGNSLAGQGPQPHEAPVPQKNPPETLGK
jgi:hypothetical protein